MKAPTTVTLRLALDCASDGLSLALEVSEHNQQSKMLETQQSGTRTSDLLPTALQSLLEQSGQPASAITEIHLTVGPGSFTGIRLGLATASALKLLNPALQIHAYSSLQAHAQQLQPQPEAFTILLDAAGSQAYEQTFQPDATPKTEPVCTVKPAISHPGSLIFAQPTLLLPTTALPPLRAATLFAMPVNTRIPPQPLYLKPLTYKKVSE